MKEENTRNETERQEYIYKLYIDGMSKRFYIGRTVNPPARYNKHKYQLNNGLHSAIELQSEWDRNNDNKLIMDLLESTTTRFGKEREAFWIRQTANVNYNIQKMPEKICGVYRLWIDDNEDFIIIGSGDIRRRKREDRSRLKLGIFYNQIIQEQYERSKEKKINFNILEECDPLKLDDRIKYWIKLTSSYNNNILNSDNKPEEYKLKIKKKASNAARKRWDNMSDDEKQAKVDQIQAGRRTKESSMTQSEKDELYKRKSDKHAIYGVLIDGHYFDKVDECYQLMGINKATLYYRINSKNNLFKDWSYTKRRTRGLMTPKDEDIKILQERYKKIKKPGKQVKVGNKIFNSSKDAAVYLKVSPNKIPRLIKDPTTNVRYV